MCYKTRLTSCTTHYHRRTGRGADAPPIRAVCRNELGQFVEMIGAKHNTCLNKTNLGSVTAVNLGSVTAVNGKNCATPQNMDPGKFLLLPPPPTESIRAKLGLPPKWMLARTPMLTTSKQWQSFVLLPCFCDAPSTIGYCYRQRWSSARLTSDIRAISMKQ